MHLTTKQRELLRVIGAGNADGTPTDLDEILERVRYETTKPSLQFSIRALVGHALIEKRGVEKRRGRQRQVIAATELGLAYAGGKRPEPADNPIVSTVEDDDLDAALGVLD
jgi:DNA-binding PadR family transcriptional regulator